MYNGPVKIHYTIEGDGPPLLLHHGFMGSSEGWRSAGYIDALSTQFLVIAMDARGHGKSDKPHDATEYTMQLRTADIAAVLDDAGVDKVRYWGYSMGGRTGFAFAQYYPDRLHSFVNGAAAPSSPKLEETRIRRAAEALRSGDVNAIAQSFFVTPEAAAVMIAGNDLDALAAAQLGLLTWDGIDPASLRVRSLHYAGERDPLFAATKRAADAMPGARFHALPGLNHLTGFTRSEVVLPQATSFLR